MKKAQVGAAVKAKAKPKSLPPAGKQTPADFYPESYDKLPRTKGGGANYNGPKVGPREKTVGGMSKNGSKLTKAGMHKMPDGSMMKNSMMKMGGAMAKQAAVAIAMKKAGKSPKKKMGYGGEAASMVPPAMMKKGGAMKKCRMGCK